MLSGNHSEPFPFAMLLILVAFGTTQSAEPEPPKMSKLIESLGKSDWKEVSEAKKSLVNAQAKSIPELLKMTSSKEVVELTNTADLIYPGAKTFYGHGHIIDYDLDVLGIRAGWVLEEMTFQNFGFSECAIREEDLLKQALVGRRDVPLTEVVQLKQRGRERLAVSSKKANAWWKNCPSGFSTRKAIEDVLDSKDSFRQMNALHWLRFERTGCEDCDLQWYKAVIIPKVETLVRLKERRVSEQAKHLVGENPMFGDRKP
jgi:hypothetical protein